MSDRHIAHFVLASVLALPHDLISDWPHDEKPTLQSRSVKTTCRSPGIRDVSLNDISFDGIGRVLTQCWMSASMINLAQPLKLLLLPFAASSLWAQPVITAVTNAADYTPTLAPGAIAVRLRDQSRSFAAVPERTSSAGHLEHRPGHGQRQGGALVLCQPNADQFSGSV